MKHFVTSFVEQPVVNTHNDIPLVIDLDNTLLCTDSLVEGIRYGLTHEPAAFCRIVWNCVFRRKGRLALKWQCVPWSLKALPQFPMNETVLGALYAAAAAGRPVVLATGATEPVALAVAQRVNAFTSVISSDTGRNLVGEEKAVALVSRYGERGFDYLGDSRQDIPVWKVSRKGFVVGSPHYAPVAGLQHLAPRTWRSRVSALARAMRVHQWIKNLLVFLPMILAHMFTWRALGASVLAFFSISLCASAIYILNDILDLDDDRAHPRKTRRPFAAGQLALTTAPLLFLIFTTGALLVAVSISPGCVAATAFYLCLSIIYAVWVKQVLVLDIMVLAWLYVQRVIIGVAAIRCELSNWLLLFVFTLFLGLAILKRAGALSAPIPVEANTRRDWHGDDKTTLLSLAACCGYGTLLTLALYINSPVASSTYTNPAALWGIALTIFYWYQRLVFLCARGKLSDDPLSFATRDTLSYELFLVILLAWYIAI